MGSEPTVVKSNSKGINLLQVHKVAKRSNAHHVHKTGINIIDQAPWFQQGPIKYRLVVADNVGDPGKLHSWYHMRSTVRS